MSINELNDKVYDLNNTWQELTQTNDAIVETKNLSIDPLLTEKVHKISEYMDKQQTEIERIKASIARPNGCDEASHYTSDSTDMEYKRAFCSYLRKGGTQHLAILSIRV